MVADQFLLSKGKVSFSPFKPERKSNLTERRKRRRRRKRRKRRRKMRRRVKPHLRHGLHNTFHGNLTHF